MATGGDLRARLMPAQNRCQTKSTREEEKYATDAKKLEAGKDSDSRSIARVCSGVPPSVPDHRRLVRATETAPATTRELWFGSSVAGGCAARSAHRQGGNASAWAQRASRWLGFLRCR